jgi:hypothetical protein
MADVPDNRRLEVLAETLLADAAFVFAEASQSFAPKGNGLYLGKVTITCAEAFELLVVAEIELAKSLAANLLGIEEESEEALRSSADAVGEWVNILAGSLAVECEGPCRIGIPVVTTETGAKAGMFLGRAFRRANLITENGQYMAVGLWRAEGR